MVKTNNIPSMLIIVFLVFINSAILGQKPAGNERIAVSKDNVFDKLANPKIGVDRQTGTVRYLYAKLPQKYTGTADAAANEFLHTHGAVFGIDKPEEMLALDLSQKTPGGTHVIYRQIYQEVPVYRSDIHITVSTENQIAFVASSLQNIKKLNSRKAHVSRQEAISAARKHIAVKGIDFVPAAAELVAYPEGEAARLMHCVRIITDNPRGDWEVLIDALDGKVIKTYNRIMHNQYVPGSGAVFDPDPLTSANVYYGENFSDPDGADQDNVFLNEQRILVDLPQIYEQDSLFYLQSPFARLVDLELPHDDFPVLSHPDSFIFKRSEQGFEDVMVFYHIDKSYRYLQSLGFEIPGLYNFKADPHGADGEDNSYYLGGGANFCVFGEGGVDDAEDAAVIWHEYAHAIQENIVRPYGMTYSGETKSLQEGSSDYWASSYKRAQNEFGWQHVFMWDAGIVSDDSVGIFWDGRRSDTDLKYPDDYDFDPERAHYSGQIWSSALMHIQDAISKEVTDRLFIQAHYLWGSGPGLRDAARAIIQADSLLYGGIHVPQMIPWLQYHGLVNMDDYLPKIVHLPLHDREDVTGPYRFSAQVNSDTLHMNLTYWFDDLSPVSIPMLNDSIAGNFFVEIAGPDNPAEINYYFAVSDSVGSIVFDPPLAPLEYHSFTVGPDTIPPQVQFAELTDQALQRWPVKLSVLAKDNLGIKSVQAEYYVNWPDTIGSFRLEDQGADIYSAFFPVPGEKLEENDSLFYRLRITDVAADTHVVMLPDTGYYSFRLLGDGGVITYNFEFDNNGFAGTGDWQWGVPANGPSSAYQGEKTWATQLNQVYSAGPLLSQLLTPEIDLTGFNNARLEFWHWYQIERPFDGGNVKIKSDTQPEWQILVPLSGYDVFVDTSFANPMGGEPAFSGSRTEWTAVTFNLDDYTGQKVQIKFDFGVDITESDLGWYIDLFSISDKAAIISAPFNLQVIDDRDKVSLSWESEYNLLKSEHFKRSTFKIPVPENQVNALSYKLPKFYIYRSLDAEEYVLFDSTKTPAFSDSLVKPGFTYAYYITFSNGLIESAGTDTVHATVEPITLVKADNSLPTSYSLFQNQPNPFNPSTIIRYQLPVASAVELEVFNILGEKVATLVSEYQNAGHYNVTWNGAQDMPSGMYVYRLSAGTFQKTKKMLLLK